MQSSPSGTKLSLVPYAHEAPGGILKTIGHHVFKAREKDPKCPRIESSVMGRGFVR